MYRWILAGARQLTAMLPRLAYPVLRGPLRGTRVILGAAAGPGGGASIYLNRVEPQQTLAFAAALNPGDVVFDLGANVGYYTLLAARRVGPRGAVFAFEPAARNIAYLYRHLELNRVTNVTLVTAACSDALTLEAFSTGGNCAMGHLGDDGNPGAAVPVLTVPVDAIVQRFGAMPRVIKVDVEGAELAVLRGAQDTLRRAKPTLFLSTHSDRLRQACLDTLALCGYVCTPLIPDRRDPSEFVARPAGPRPS